MTDERQRISRREFTALIRTEIFKFLFHQEPGNSR